MQPDSGVRQRRQIVDDNRLGEMSYVREANELGTRRLAGAFR